jgi:phosphoglycolate phosphatase
MIKACIFDLDGTVLDTIASITHFVNVAMDKYSIRRISIEECKIFVGCGARVLIEKTLASRGVDPSLVPEVLDYYNSEYNKDISYLVSPFSGIPELLASLRARGILVGVVSNKPDFITRPLVRKMLPGLVDIAFGGRDGIPLKPDPKAPLEVLSEFGVSPSECAFIGDTGVDMQTGKNLGAALTVGVSWGFRSRSELSENGADAIVDHPSEIFPLVASDD